MGTVVCQIEPTRADYEWQLASLNDRLMNRTKYEAIGEDVDAVVAGLQHWLIEYENCHPKRADYTGEVVIL